MAIKGTGPAIHGETANAWERRSKEFLLAPVAKGGMGLSPAKVDDIEKRLKKAGGEFAASAGKPRLTGKVVALDLTDPDNPKEVNLDALPVAQVGRQYYCLLDTDGGYEPVSIQALALPPGCSLDLHGVLSGVPLVSREDENAAMNAIRFKMVDRLGQETAAELTLDVEPAPIQETAESPEAENSGDAVPPAATPRHSLLNLTPPSMLQSLAVPSTPTPAVDETNDAKTGQAGQDKQGGKPITPVAAAKDETMTGATAPASGGAVTERKPTAGDEQDPLP